MRLAIRLWRFVQYLFRFAAYVRLMSQPAFRLAQNPAEKATVMCFSLRLVLFRGAAVIARLLQHSIAHEDIPLTLQGVKYCVGINSHETTVFGEIYHDHGYDRVADFVPKAGWIVFDVGANAGIFAVQQALRGAHVYAFEPNHDCYRRMMWTINANHLSKRIFPFKVAIAETSGSGTMVIERGFTLGGTIMLHKDPSTNGEATIKITSLDDIVPTLGITHVDLVKIDTEGAEVEVLCGAKQTLGLVDRVILEYHSHDLGAQVKAVLQDLGFMLVRQDDQDSVIGRGILYAAKASRPEQVAPS